jgi:P27 family predicted phage terminase small subunit
MSNPRKPLELKKLQGTDQPCRRGPRIQGGFEPLRMPYGLAEEAVPYWHKLMPVLAGRGILVESDITALADMCLVKARLDQAEEILRTQGLVVERRDDKGNVTESVRNPVTVVVNQYRTAWLAYCARFALTPSDRAGVTVEKPAEKSLSEQLNDLVMVGKFES